MVDALGATFQNSPRNEVFGWRRGIIAAPVAMGIFCALLLSLGWQWSSPEPLATRRSDSTTEFVTDDSTESLHKDAVDDPTVGSPTDVSEVFADRKVEMRGPGGDEPEGVSAETSDSPLVQFTSGETQSSRSGDSRGETADLTMELSMPADSETPILPPATSSSEEQAIDVRAESSIVKPATSQTEYEASSPRNDRLVTTEREPVDSTSKRTSPVISERAEHEEHSNERDTQKVVVVEPTTTRFDTEDSQSDDDHVVDLQAMVDRFISTREKPRMSVESGDYSAVLGFLGRDDGVSRIQSSMKLTLEPSGQPAAEQGGGESSNSQQDEQVSTHAVFEQREAKAANHLRAGTSFVMDGLLDEAIDQYSVAVRLARDPADALRLRGIAYAKMSRFGLALTDLNRTIEMKREPVALRLRGYVHLARRDLRRALEDQAAVERFAHAASLHLVMQVNADGASAKTEDQRQLKLRPLQSVKLTGVRGDQCQVHWTAGGRSLVGWVQSDQLTPLVEF